MLVRGELLIEGRYYSKLLGKTNKVFKNCKDFEKRIPKDRDMFKV